MLGRANGLNRLDLSVEGFWRSFAAILAIIPAALLSFLSDRRISAAGGAALDPLAPALALQSCALVADWLAFPLLLALLAGRLGLGGAYVPFVIARNWAAVIMAAMVAPVHALILLNLLPPQVAPIVLLAVIAATLGFSYALTKTSLSVPGRVAAPIVIVDFLLSITIWTAFSRLA